MGVKKEKEKEKSNVGLAESPPCLFGQFIFVTLSKVKMLYKNIHSFKCSFLLNILMFN